MKGKDKNAGPEIFVARRVVRPMNTRKGNVMSPCPREFADPPARPA